MTAVRQQLGTSADQTSGPTAPERNKNVLEYLRDLPPDRDAQVAVAARGQRVTYGQLISRSTQIAHALQARGVSRGDVVGVYLPRIPDAIAAVFAIFIAGAVYVPLDPNDPAARSRHVVADSGAGAVITSEALRPSLDIAADVLVIEEVLAADVLPSARLTARWPIPAPHDLAYIIYTSGSTGNPKGVMIRHSSLSAFLAWALEAFSPAELGGVLASTRFVFDISLFEILVPLLAGGQSILVENIFGLDESRDEQVRMVNTIPSLLSAFLRRHQLPASVRTVCLAGERLPRDLAERLHRMRSDLRVVNAYGPTEDTIYSTTADVAAGSEPLIGRPLPGTRAYVVDDDWCLVAPQQIGELVLAGAGLARGYRNQASLTEDRFPEVLIDGQVQRVYRTGDLVRRDDRGNLAYLGRVDDQVKINGIRVEPEEIETVLRRHPVVDQAAVAPRTSAAPPGQELVAFLVTSSPIDRQVLLEHASETLPSALVPRAVRFVESLPLTTTGKLDRKSLKEMAKAVEVSSSSRELTEATRSYTSAERALAPIWRSVFELDAHPRPDDDFFARGGDSLLAAELMVAIEEQLGVKLPSHALLKHGTLAALAAHVDSASEDGSGIVKLNANGDASPFIMFHAAEALSVLHSLASSLGPRQPIFAFPTYRELAPSPLSIEQTADAYMVEVEQLRNRGPYVIAGQSIGALVAFEAAYRLRREGEPVNLVAVLDEPAPATFFWRRRVRARAAELLGWGPESRSWSKLAAAKLARRRSGESDGSPASEAIENDWFRAVAAVERAYEPPVLDVPILLLYTSESARVTASRTLGWQSQTTEGVFPMHIGGDHLSLLRRDHAHRVVQILAGALQAHESLLERQPPL